MRASIQYLRDTWRHDTGYGVLYGAGSGEGAVHREVNTEKPPSAKLQAAVFVIIIDRAGCVSEVSDRLH